MICLIDNYDSFTYNIVAALEKNHYPVKVILNDPINIESISKDIDSIDGFIFSPGPGPPSKAQLCHEILEKWGTKKPILGICLGHQVIAQYFGAQIINSPRIMHGKISTIYHYDENIFQHIPQAFKATRYHSLIVEKETLPEELVKTCWTQNESGQSFEIMGLKHKRYNIEGLQFHPESIMTPYGEKLMTQFIDRIYSGQ